MEEKWFEGFNEVVFKDYADDFIGNTTKGKCYPIVSQITRMLNDRAGVAQK